MKHILLLFSLLAFLACSTPPQTDMSDPEVLEQVDREGINKTMYRHRKHVSNCYGQALLEKGQENLKGKIMMQFRIGLDGKAKDIEALKEESTIDNNSLNDCIISGLKSWDFPVHPQGKVITIKYPLVFSDAPPASMQQKLDQFEKVKKGE
jgi:hypothetical protein